MTSEIEIKKLKRKDGNNKDINIKGGIVLEGFPSSTGFINAIASECLIRSTKTDLVAFLDSPDFPPISVVHNYVPRYPVRIYVNESLNVAFFVSDINIEKTLQRDVAKAILNWAGENECKLIISAQGIVPLPPPPSNSHSGNTEGNSKVDGINNQDSKSSTTNTSTSTSHPDLTKIYAVTSTESAARLIVEHSSYFTRLRDGTLTGIPAILLNQGALTNLDVIVFLVNVLPNIPDFHAAAVVSQAVSRVVPNLSCDIGALMVEARIIENRMNNVRAEQKRISYIA